MKKLTSKSTFFNKKIFPTIWFGFLAIFVITSLFAGGDNGPGPMFVVMPIFMAVFGYFIMKKLVFDLIDEVYDEGDSLLFKNSGKEVRVSLRDIKNVSYQTMMNPPKVTLSLRHETDLGSELSFSPPMSFIPFKKNKDIEELIDRIDQARG
ncbi:hypothetical protein [uncultured Shewanella sp.]|uniref:hypothetical protein n=1 Tax=uncultured Shewanella sp. TaxID=173975 RepID=UPI002637621B|nr:hypothetical protein [uncultured Shewanella sp.]